ncbi:MAG: transglutaminase-like domain-containing protein [Leptospirales bacterium]|nr:transglutaminase-like domain-containing protein [Leptospirales bacterium]
MENMQEYLKPTDIIDSENEIVVEYMRGILGKDDEYEYTPREKAIKLYLHVRDDIKYNPYLPFYKPEHYRSSNVIKSKEGFCIGKAGLLCALARRSGIPARVGFATVKNHLTTKQLKEFLGTDIITYHGYTELWLDEKWVKATPAFNAGLCALHKVAPLEFDGINDSIFHEFNSEKSRFMEYVDYHGEFSDIPLDIILESWRDIYGEERVDAWIKLIENAEEKKRDFMKEDII